MILADTWDPAGVVTIIAAVSAALCAVIAAWRSNAAANNATAAKDQTTTTGNLVNGRFGALLTAYADTVAENARLKGATPPPSVDRPPVQLDRAAAHVALVNPPAADALAEAGVIDRRTPDTAGMGPADLFATDQRPRAHAWTIPPTAEQTTPGGAAWPPPPP